MSRIGRMPITVPAGVKVEVAGSVVKVSGPKGSLEREIASNKIQVKAEAAEVSVLRADDKKETKAMHGLYLPRYNHRGGKRNKQGTRGADCRNHSQ